MYDKDFIKTFKAIGEPTRIRILRLLATRDMYVCELEVVLDMSQPRISTHIRTLREASLIKEDREGRKIRLSLDNGRLSEVLQGFSDYLSCDISTLDNLRQEAEKLKELETNPVAGCCER